MYGAYAVLCLHLQGQIWVLLSANRDRLVGSGLIVGSLLSAIAILVTVSFLTPSTTEKWRVGLAAWCDSLPRFAPFWLIALAVAGPALAGYWILDRFQNSGDEFAYYFQGAIFARGHLWAPAPPLGNTFVPFRTWVLGDKWVSQYPPGWPLVLAAAMVVGFPAWAVNALLGGGTAAALASRVWQFKDRGVIYAGAGLLVSTPFYLLNAGSFYSHMLPALLIVLLCLTCVWYERDRHVAALVASGALLGLIGLTRYFSLILLTPALCYWLIVESRRPWRAIVIWILAGIPFLALLLTYQYWITGSPLRSTYALISSEDVFVSFEPAALARGVKLTGYRFEELTVWAVPLLLPIYVFCLASKSKSRSLAFYDLIFPSFVLGFVFFADLGGNRYGPRYYFDAYPVMLLTLVSAAPQASEWAWRLFNRRPGVHVVLTSALYLLTALPCMSVAYYREVQSREDAYRMAAAHGLKNAIVIIDAPGGHGLEAVDLARNDIDLRAPILYARAAAVPADLHRLFPSRSLWIYERNSAKRAGTITPVPIGNDGLSR